MFSILPMLVVGQSSNFEDDFTDQNISDWDGNNSDFVFVTESGNVLLQQNAVTAGTSQLSIASANVVGFWEFFIRLDFNPSDGNKAEFYLMSDSANFDQALNGYMLQAGENGSGDIFRLFRITAGAKDGEVLTGTTDISGGGNFRVKVIRDASGNWSLEVASSYSGATMQEATGTDNTYTSASYFGFKTTYTATRTDKFFFDFKIDIPPIQVTNVSIPNPTTISIDFSKDYDPATLQTSDFTVNPGGLNPVGVTQTSSSSIGLNFNTTLPSGTSSLFVTEIDDSNNATTLADTTITLFRFDEYQDGDIIINEFLKDPPGGLAEYVELRNTSSRLINLKGWEVGDNNSLTTIVNQDFALLPDSFVVVSSDTSALKAVFGNIYMIEASLPAFNNTTDQVRLYDEHGTNIDSLEYTPEWGGDNVALERRSAATSAIFRENWEDSPNILGGTAGKENEVLKDISHPVITNTSIVSNDTIKIFFNETLDISNAESQVNYSGSPSISISSITANGNNVTLVLSSVLQDGITYEITVRNQQDVFGNTQPDTTFSIRYVEFSPSTANDVVINEILYRKANEDAPEFVELFNRAGSHFNLSGWELSDAAGNTAAIPDGTSLESGNYIVLTNQQAFANSIPNGIALSGFPSLNDSGDAIIIKNENGHIIDSLFYDERFGGNNQGVSAERKDPNGASNDANNWASNTSQTGTSAGIPNQNFAPDIISPEIIFSKLQADGNVFIAFSEFVDLSNSSIHVASQQRTILSFDQNRANRVVVDGSGIDANTSFEASITNLEDIVGNVTALSSAQVSLPISKGSVIINEILFDPLANSDDNLPDQTEYIELYNTQDYAISLEGVFLHDAPDENNEINKLIPVSTSFKWIQPGGYFLIFSEDEAPGFSESQLAEYFEIENEPDQFTIQINRSSLSLSASGDAIFISDSTGATIDSVFYNESWHNPNRISTKGVSLEKINPAGPGNESSNWSSSTEISGGTPNVENSIFQEEAPSPANSGIAFSPNPFSPDGDGFEDFLSISYTLDEADYLLRVRIYDRYGREVRELVDGQPAGFNGNLTWDGLTDDRKKNRVGIYIVLFEAYNSAEGRDRTFKETVVLARMF